MFIPYEEYIWGDKFKVHFSNLNENVCFSNNPDLQYLRKNLSQNAKLIVTHNGDNPVYCDNLNEYKNCQYWFGQNIMCEDSRVFPLPIGLENDYIRGQPQRKMILEEKSKLNVKPTKLLYLNCSIGTCRVDRQPAYNYFSNKNWCTVKTPNHSNYYIFCDDVLDHQFMISPRGNGLDCHRSWEILYLNRYPVMKKYYGLEKLFEDLPVVFVNDWSEITPEFLNNKLEIIRNTNFNMNKLKFSYWKTLIETYIGKIK